MGHVGRARVGHVGTQRAVLFAGDLRVGDGRCLGFEGGRHPRACGVVVDRSQLHARRIRCLEAGGGDGELARVSWLGNRAPCLPRPVVDRILVLKSGPLGSSGRQCVVDVDRRARQGSGSDRRRRWLLGVWRGLRDIAGGTGSGRILRRDREAVGAAILQPAHRHARGFLGHHGGARGPRC